MKNLKILLFVVLITLVYKFILNSGYQQFQSREYTEKYVEGRFEVVPIRNAQSGEVFWNEGHTEKVLTSSTFYYLLFSLMFGLHIIPSFLLLKLLGLKVNDSKFFNIIWLTVSYFNILLIFI